MKSRIAAVVLAVLVVSSVSAQAQKWLSKEGADTDVRVLGHLSEADPNDFITCTNQHVKLSSIQGAVLKPANIGCPDSVGLNSADSDQQAEQERRHTELQRKQRERERRVIEKLQEQSSDSDDDPEP